LASFPEERNTDCSDLPNKDILTKLGWFFLLRESFLFIMRYCSFNSGCTRSVRRLPKSMEVLSSIVKRRIVYICEKHRSIWREKLENLQVPSKYRNENEDSGLLGSKVLPFAFFIPVFAGNFTQ